MFLERSTTGLLVIDVQERLFSHIENSCSVLHAMLKAIEGFQIFKLPVVVTEQYPQGLGATIAPLREQLEEDHIFAKTTFSCCGNPEIRQKILGLPVTDWVLVGIEAHVCVLQTGKDLLEAGKRVVVLNDAIASRSIYDFSTAIAELRDCGARVSNTETVLFELLRDSASPEFKEISALVKKASCSVSCGS